MRQSDGILARFAGPVTLHVSRVRRIVGLIVCASFAAFGAWLVFGEDARRLRTFEQYDTIMSWAALLGAGALTIRGAILLLVPGAASLTLDGEGFTIGQVFNRIRTHWRNVDGFRIERVERRGGAVEEVVYGDGGAVRVLPQVYGRPRLRGVELVALMNAWRERALAHPAESLPRDDDSQRR
jgi:hypothetical protein